MEKPADSIYILKFHGWEIDSYRKEEMSHHVVVTHHETTVLKEIPQEGSLRATVKYPAISYNMLAVALVIPLLLACAAGIGGYLIYRYVVYDALCKMSVNRILSNYDIRKTPSQIVREFHEIIRGEKMTEEKVRTLEKMYRQTDPDQFLEMYDALRERRSGQ